MLFLTIETHDPPDKQNSESNEHDAERDPSTRRRYEIPAVQEMHSVSGYRAHVHEQPAGDSRAEISPIPLAVDEIILDERG